MDTIPHALEGILHQKKNIYFISKGGHFIIMTTLRINIAKYCLATRPEKVPKYSAPAHQGSPTGRPLLS